MTKEELINGKYWLATAEYPTMMQDATTEYIINSSVNPYKLEATHPEILEEIVQDCFDNYSYLDSPDEEDYDSEEEYLDAYDCWEDGTFDSIVVTYTLITKELLEEYDYEDLLKLEMFTVNQK